MGLNSRKNRSFWEKLNRGLNRQKRIRSIDKIFGDKSSIAGHGDDFLMGKVGKISNQFGMNYVAATMNNRAMRYQQYEVMDATSPMCANALDTYASNATLPDVLENHRVLIESTDVEIKEELEDLLYLTLNVDFNLPGWVRTLCKYGDLIVAFVIDEEGKHGIITYVVNTMHQIDIIPKKDLQAKRMYYEYVVQPEGTIGNGAAFLAGPNATSASATNAKILKQDEFIHFSIKGDPIYEPFGKSIFEQARFSWSQVRLMEDAVMTYRVVRAPERKVFKIEIGGLPQDQIAQYIRQAMGEIKRIPIANPETGEYNLQYNVQSILEDYVFPQRNGQGSSVDTLPGGQNTDAIQDLEYFKSNLRASLKVPKAYLEYDENLATAKGLAMEDNRFASQIKFIQSVIENELFKASVIHLLAKGYSAERIENFNIRLVNPSTQEEKDRLEIIQARSDLVGSLMSNKVTSLRDARAEIMKFDEAKIARIETEIVQEARKQWEISQLENSGTITETQSEGGDDLGGAKGMEDSFGGGGGLGDLGGGDMGGGGDFGSGLSDMAEGEPGDMGAGLDMGDQAAPGETVDLGMPDMGSESGGEEAPEKPSGGTETSEIDPLRIVGDKLIDKKDANKRHTESLDIQKSNVNRQAEQVYSKIESILRNVKRKNRK